MTLSYANGRGYKNAFSEEKRVNLTNILINKDFEYPATFPVVDETHGGDDVGVFALGSLSHLFSGVYEQSTIPHLIGYAACIGNGLTACNRFA